MARRILNLDIDHDAICDQWIANNTNGKSPTINDIADIAGVSKKTVSRVINDSEFVSPKTRAVIKAIISKLGFTPDPQARGLAFRRSFLVGLIFDNPNPQYVVNMQQGILDGLKDTGFELVVHPCDRKSETFLQDAKKFVREQKLFGVIMTPSVSEDESIAKAMRETGCEYIRIASMPLDEERHMIVTDDRHGAKLAAAHLAELGHKRIALITGRADFFSVSERTSGFKEVLSEYGLALPPEYILQGDYSFESGMAAGDALLKLDPAPTAVFAENDEMAAGVIQSLHQAGKQAPESLSVIGYDDFALCTRIWPTLTTIHSPTRKVGELAA